jgi:hypothetical protein
VASLLLGGAYTYAGDVSIQHIGAIWCVFLNATMIAGGTALLALNRGVRAR